MRLSEIYASLWLGDWNKQLKTCLRLNIFMINVLMKKYYGDNGIIITVKIPKIHLNLHSFVLERKSCCCLRFIIEFRLLFIIFCLTNFTLFSKFTLIIYNSTFCTIFDRFGLILSDIFNNSKSKSLIKMYIQ